MSASMSLLPSQSLWLPGLTPDSGRFWSLLWASQSQGGGEEGDLVVRVPVEGLEERSIQDWIIRLPVRFCGWGFRSLKQTCGPAFLGALETSIPRMKEICPLLAGVWGGDECWGTGAAQERRRRKVLEYGTQEGEERKRTWCSLTREAREFSEWMDKEVEPVFSQPVEGAGNGSVTGETRRLVMEAMETSTQPLCRLTAR